MSDLPCRGRECGACELTQIRLKHVCAFHNRKRYRFGTRIVVNCYTTRQYYNAQTLQAITRVSIGTHYYK